MLRRLLQRPRLRLRQRMQILRRIRERREVLRAVEHIPAQWFSIRLRLLVLVSSREDH